MNFLAKEFIKIFFLKVIKANTKERLKPGKILEEANVKFTTL